jgi:iron complex transport system ATP-binding protein
VTLTALDVADLSVCTAGVTILDRVSFTVDRGCMLAVIGPNGAGKTTLLRCLDGLEPDAQGTIRIAGQDVSSCSRRDLARAVSYVPQRPPGALPFTVRSFVEMGRYPHLRGWGGLGAEDLRAVHRALTLTDTTHLERRSMDTLSGGERQRVLIAAALAQGGSILLLDEPTSALDYRHQVQVLGLLARLQREADLTVVLVTHDLNAAVAAADDVLALDDGRIVASGSPRELFTAERLGRIYGTEFAVIPDRDRDLPLVVTRGSLS